MLFLGPRWGKALSNLCRAVLLLQHCRSDAHETQSVEKETGTNCIAPNQFLREQVHLERNGKHKIKARIIPWRDQFCRRQFLLYWKQKKKGQGYEHVSVPAAYPIQGPISTAQSFFYFKLKNTCIFFLSSSMLKKIRIYVEQEWILCEIYKVHKTHTTPSLKSNCFIHLATYPIISVSKLIFQLCF